MPEIIMCIIPRKQQIRLRKEGIRYGSIHRNQFKLFKMQWPMDPKRQQKLIIEMAKLQHKLDLRIDRYISISILYSKRHQMIGIGDYFANLNNANPLYFGKRLKLVS